MNDDFEIEIEIDFEGDEPQTEPFLEKFHEPLWSFQAISETEIAPLPRARAPRSTADLDDEITNIVAKPA